MLSRFKMVAIIGFTLCLVYGLYCVAEASTTPGQSRTLLPNGTTLITGGLDQSGQPSDSVSVQELDGSTRQLSVHLAAARVGHTATVLPDGTVLIFGGIGADKHLVSTLELFNPQTESLLTIDTSLIPRAFHTGTLLTNGQLVVLGGVTEGGIFTDIIQLWNYQSRTAVTIPARLHYPRIDHSAALLANGDVLVTGGKTAAGSDQIETEIFDHVKLVTQVAAVTANTAGPIQIAESIPPDKAADVAITALIALRFTTPAVVTSVTDSTVSLSDAAGNQVAIQVVAAEGGRLAFVVPANSLLPGTQYQLTVSNVADSAGNFLATTTIHFQTAGLPDDSVGELWIPGSDALKGNWNSQTGSSSWQKLPPLQAAAGITALSGQVLRLNGLPLAGVLLSVGSSSTKSDSTGRFLLKNLKAGHQVLTIDGRTANRSNAQYGLYEVGVDVKAPKTNVLKYTIWMTRLDTEHAITIPSPTTAPDTVLTTPLLPGLEFHVPANTVIVDHEGHPARRFTITPIPLDKPPFPLPLGVAVPIYFTIQPGGSYIDVRSAPNTASKGGRLIYPNSFGNPAGTVFDFWNYDAESRGWYVYGQGKVTNDRTQIVPNPGVVVYQLSGAMVGGTGPAPGQFPPSGECARAGEPVDLSTGLFEYDKTDLFLKDIIPIQLRRTYRTNDNQQRPFGIGTTHNYDIFIGGDVWPYTYQELILPNGSRIRFNRTSPGTGYIDAVYTNTEADTPYYGATISWNNGNPLPGAWLLRLRNGTVLSFPDSSFQNNQDAQAIIQITDRYGNNIKFQRDSSARLNQLTSPSGRYISFHYDPSGRISSVTDNSGRSVGYQYDPDGNLFMVTDANGGTTTFTYDSNHNMLTITDARSIIYLTNEYDSNGRVTKQTQADGSTYHFTWTPSNNSFQGWQFVCPECQQGGSFSRYSPNDSEGYSGLISAVDVTDPRGYVRHVQFNSYGHNISETLAVGQPEQQTFTYSYYGDNLLESVTDALSRTTSFDYDSPGNETRITRLAGSSNPVTTIFSYTLDFNQLATMTDPINHTTTIGYDQGGNATSVTDPLGHQTTATYYTTGQVHSILDSLNNAVTFGYLRGDLVTITDPLGDQTVLFEDLVGRLQSLTDPIGNTTTYQYNNTNQLLAITDALGNNTSFTYDANGNVKSITDANGHTNRYDYDNMDRIMTRTDPLSRSESYGYDVGGNLVSLTDRKQQVSSYYYDALNRLTSVAFGVVNGVPQSTIGYSYDGGNRLYQAVDSISGTIIRHYDLLDRPMSETTPQGSVAYTYDNTDRRLTMQVSGQPLTNYSWDDANRLTGITQGSLSVGFTYDTDNRRQTMTLPNGIVASYSYNNDSRLSGISYSLGQSPIGTLSYGYDALARRTTISGSLAQYYGASAGPVSSSSYDAANELTNWAGINISTDANGNVTSNPGYGSNGQYSWDARDQLVSIGNGTVASFSYDAFGRRVSKTVMGISTGFLYDGSNPVQELSGASPTANLLTGGLDEYFARTDAAGTESYVTDALGSTLELTDANGAQQTSYSYLPFGRTSAEGNPSTNSFEFTGRENDGVGLHYNRARYYDPTVRRFISEDPVGLAGGLNFYSYTLNNPVEYRDPSGNWVPVIVAGIGAGFGGLTEGLEGYRCGDRGWKLAGDIGRGAAAGGIGALAGLATGFATGNPFLGGAAGSGAYDLVNTTLQGGWSNFGWDQGLNMVGDIELGAAIGGLAEIMGPTVRGGWNFNPFRSTRTFGPKAMQEYSRDALSGSMGTGASMVLSIGRGNCGRQ